MDRDKRFDRVKLAYDAIVCQEGESFECPVQYVKDSYAKDVLDEFVIPGYNKTDRPADQFIWQINSF